MVVNGVGWVCVGMGWVHVRRLGLVGERVLVDKKLIYLYIYVFVYMYLFIYLIIYSFNYLFILNSCKTHSITPVFHSAE